MPGLINGHNHSPMLLFRGMADDLDLSTWLQDHIFPAEVTHVNEEMVYWCSKLAAAEMLLSGTTCVADAYFYSSEIARAFDEAGIRAIVAHGVLDFPAPGVPDVNKNIETVERYIEHWKDKNSRITPAVFAHSPYTCSPRTLIKAKALATKHQLPFFIHLAETEAESAIIIDPQGPSPVKHLEALNLLDSNSICIHAIWLDNEDLEIISQSGASVITCPQSNSKLASGIAKVPEMLNKGIRVGLGTDGCASNNSLNMFSEMNLLAKLHKATLREATVLPARQVLQYATQSCAKALGLSKLGKIEEGAVADLILLDLNTPHLTPFYNQDLLVYSAMGSEINTVIIDGKVRVHNRSILSFDVDEAIYNVKKLAKKINHKIQ